MEDNKKDTHSPKWMSIENARQALELLISKPKAGIFFEMEMLISEKDQKTRKELEEVYAYAITLAVELLRRAETDALYKNPGSS